MYVDHYTYYFPLHDPRQRRLQSLNVRLGFLGQPAMQLSHVAGTAVPPEPLEERSFREILFY